MMKIHTMPVILLVEDDEIVCHMYAHVLKKHGFSVCVAEDGEEGLKAALNKHPELILLDIRMPKMDGITMMHKVRQTKWGESVPIILLTNLDMNEERLHSVNTDHPLYYVVKANTTPKKVVELVTEVLYGKNSPSG